MRQDDHTFSSATNRERLTGPEDVLRLLEGEVADARTESVHVFHLDSDRHLLGRSIIGGGLEVEVELPIRRIIGDALEFGSSMLVVVHNHPSGDPSPSRADQLATKKLADITRALDIRLLDHMIVAGDNSYSFAESGLL